MKSFVITRRDGSRHTIRTVTAQLKKAGRKLSERSIRRHFGVAVKWRYLSDRRDWRQGGESSAWVVGVGEDRMPVASELPEVEVVRERVGHRTEVGQSPCPTSEPVKTDTSDEPGHWTGIQTPFKNSVRPGSEESGSANEEGEALSDVSDCPGIAQPIDSKGGIGRTGPLSDPCPTPVQRRCRACGGPTGAAEVCGFCQARGAV